MTDTTLKSPTGAGVAWDALGDGERPTRTLASRARDVVEMAKPRVTLLVLFTTAVGLWLAPGSLGPAGSVLFLVATGALVASANTLNCWMERETDGLMRRTRSRALPAGRLEPWVAVGSGVLLGVVALSLMAWITNPVTVSLGGLALLIYVFVYTPLKRVTWWAVIVGAVPGAIPPLMGWTAITGATEPRAWFLFGLLFLWQLPHFIAISLYLEEDYRRGGLQVLPVARGHVTARRHLLAYTTLLVPFSLVALPLGMAGSFYIATALLLGAGFLWIAWQGRRPGVGAAWARKAFLYSLIYLTAVVAVLLIDAR